jgi:hypothetical protein
LDALFKKEILTPKQLYSLNNLIQLLHLQQQRTDLYNLELQSILNEEEKW